MYVCMHPICYGLAAIQRCAGISWLKDGGSMHPAEERTMWSKQKNDTSEVGEGQHVWSRQGKGKGRRHTAERQAVPAQPLLAVSLPWAQGSQRRATGLLCCVQPGRGQVQGSRGKSGWCYWTREMHADMRCSGGFGGGGVREQTVGGVREQKLSEATQELVDIWA